jgi:hypothetical protein
MQGQAAALSFVMGMSLALPDFESSPMAPPLCQLGQILSLGCVGEFARATKALVPFAPTLASLESISALLTLHPLDTNLPYSNSLLNLKSNLELKLFMNFFKLIFLRMSHLLASGHFGMVFEHLQDSFDPKDSTSGFIQLHQLHSHVATRHILGSTV